uniref:Uncharacterized protein n=1 Tax=Caenorhabditis japonica TaxID=281687 RepID=A0A8R1I8C6_CAEJA
MVEETTVMNFPLRSIGACFPTLSVDNSATHREAFYTEHIEMYFKHENAGVTIPIIFTLNSSSSREAYKQVLEVARVEGLNP